MTDVSAEPRVCGVCGEVARPDDNWCEACGADLAPAALEIPGDADATPAFVATGPCVSCGAPVEDITDDGWCQQCGTKQPEPGDHVVDDLGALAVVCDRGRKHGANEDAGAIGRDRDTVVLVVCDGVSSTDQSHHASQAAASVAAEVLLDGEDAIGARMVRAAAQAQNAVVEATPAASDQPPSCTFVAALAAPELDSGVGATAITVAWLGDSRAYWIDDEGARQLTRDHTWAIEQRTIGDLTEDEIASDPRAHSITRWLGADAIDVVPEIVTTTVDASGLLLVCSDGLWNYASEPNAMATLVAEHDADGPTPLELSQRLVAAANELGGHDNVTAAIARFPLVEETVTVTGSDPAALDVDSHPTTSEPTKSNGS
ncbi:MAG: PP2C family serine/threonine-protein phosphatase [Actinomycetota bacterium]